MTKLNRKQIQEKAVQILEASPDGIQWSQLLELIHQSAPDTPRNSIQGAVHHLFVTSTDIAKVARGTYRLKKYIDQDFDVSDLDETKITILVKGPGGGKISVTEQDFYASFANWLIENDEATIAVPLGGSSLGGKWGTPDVLGLSKPKAQDLLKFEPELVAAEIKATPSQPVVAFGQAVAYSLFSHRSFIVVPNTTGKEDMERLKALCSFHGLGLVTFTVDPQAPDYTMVVLPDTVAPDMFYANAMLKRLEVTSPAILNLLLS
jgi:hypothetical protein